MAAILLAAVLSLGNDGCKEPTRSVYTEQRKVPYFTVLVYELAETAGGAVTFMLFEDGAGNCFITSGVDGGVQSAPKSSCEGARKVPVEK